MTRTQLILASLVAGVLAGIAVRWADQPALTAVAGVLLPIGQMWVRALQMTLIPLIFPLVIFGLALRHRHRHRAIAERGRRRRARGELAAMTLVARTMMTIVDWVLRRRPRASVA